MFKQMEDIIFNVIYKIAKNYFLTFIVIKYYLMNIFILFECSKSLISISIQYKQYDLITFSMFEVILSNKLIILHIVISFNINALQLRWSHKSFWLT